MDGILILPGDGQGQTSADIAAQAIAAASSAVEVVRGDIGFSAYEKYGEPLPYETLDQVGGCRVVISGPTKDTSDGRNPLAMLTAQLDLYGRCRCLRTLVDGLGSPGVDLTVWGTSKNGRSDVSETRDVDGITISKYISTAAYARMMGAAITDMEIQGKTRATCVARRDMFPESSETIYDAFDALFAREGIESSHESVVNWLPNFVRDPSSYSFLVVSDLYAILAEGLASEITGGGRLSPVKLVGDDKSVILPFGDAGADAPDCPVASIVSASMALSDLGMRAESERVMDALRATLAAGERAGDAGGDMTATDFADRVIARI